VISGVEIDRPPIDPALTHVDSETRDVDAWWPWHGRRLSNIRAGVHLVENSWLDAEHVAISAIAMALQPLQECVRSVPQTVCDTVSEKVCETVSDTVSQTVCDTVCGTPQGAAGAPERLSPRRVMIM
jgi:hypothetical protein